jgi:DNA polymerase-3 subunit delta'
MTRGSADSVRAELRLARKRNKVHGAYLFEGGPGTRARELAIWFARLLLCRAGEDDPCGTCRDCRMALSSAGPGGERPTHPDLQWVEPDGAFVKVDQIRELLRELSLVANEGGRRLGLILGAERLRTEAANALLKTLEEPPADTTLILVADRSQSLPPTLRSRTMHVRVARTAEAELREALVGEGFDREDAQLASALGGGSLMGAQGWADQHLESAREIYEFLAGIQACGAAEILDFAESLRGREAGRQRAELVLDVYAAFARRHVETSSNAGDARAVERWLGHYESASKSRLEMRRRNLNPQLIVEGLLLELRAGQS